MSLARHTGRVVAASESGLGSLVAAGNLSVGLGAGDGLLDDDGSLVSVGDGLGLASAAGGGDKRGLEDESVVHNAGGLDGDSLGSAGNAEHNGGSGLERGTFNVSFKEQGVESIT